jgi:hypothetical protein
MDLIDLNQIVDFLKIEPGHGLVQTILLLMIWWSSRGVKKEISTLRDSVLEVKIHVEDRFQGIEKRLTLIENGRIK